MRVTPIAFLPSAFLALALLASTSVLAQTAPGQSAPSQSAPAQASPPPATASTSAAPAPAAAPRRSATTDDQPDSITIRLTGSTVSTFYPATLGNLTRAYVKLTGVDLSDNQLIDDFAKVNYCQINANYGKDEFLWRQAREAIRKTIERDLETYPEYFYLDGTVELGQYDFEQRAFMLDERSKFQRTGLLNMSYQSSTHDKCDNFAPLTALPRTFKFRLTNPVTLDSIPVSEGTAFQLTRLMQQTRNRDRVINVTFFMRVNDFSNVMGARSSIAFSYVRATLLSLRFYLDDGRRALIYEYKPL